MGKSVGIDLGTTNSVVAVMEGGKPTVIANAEGARTTPSVVGFNSKSGERLVGQLARRQAVVNPQNTVYSIKRFIGRRFDETASERSLVSYKVKEGSDGCCKVVIQSKEYTPEEISAMILRKLKEDAEKSVTSKPEVISWLKRSLDAVKQAHLAETPQDLQRKVHIEDRDATVDGMYLRIIVHANEHMGQLVAYARMTGVVPPWSKS